MAEKKRQFETMSEGKDAKLIECEKTFSERPNLPPTTNDIEIKKIEDKIAQQKREFDTMLKENNKLIKESETKFKNEINQLQIEKNKLVAIQVQTEHCQKMAESQRKFEIRLKGKDAQIEEGQKKLKTMETQLIAFQENLKQKDNDISELKKENNELVSKLTRTKQNLRDTKKELDDVRDMKNDAEAKTKQRNNQIRILHMKQTELVSTLEQTQSERIKVENDLLTARKQLHDNEEKMFEVREQKREAETEKHGALQRLNEMVSVIFHDKNHDIVYLSTEYRPTKLAEMFSELYDDEWTAAYTVMEDNKFQDRHMIDFLLDVVMESYVFCKNEIDNSRNKISKWFLDDGLPKVQQIRKALNYGRIAIALELLPDIEQKHFSYIKGICRHEPLKELLLSEYIRKYMALCLKLTLLMNANDPPVYLECSGWKPIMVREEDNDSKINCEMEISNEKTAAATRVEFDKDKFKEYTTRGKYTEFHVWPVMYLHKGGPILSKGIAQGVKDRKAEPSDKPWVWWN